MAKEKNMLLKWLRDAHAMESSAESILEKQVKRTKDWPDLHQRIQHHLEETRRQQTRIKDCITRLGGDTSALKELVGKFTGSMQAFGASGAEDEIIKASVSDYSFECLEIASYRSLIAACEAYGEPEIRRVCEEILAEEEAMADWLDNHIAETTRTFLSKKGVSVQPSKPGPETRREPPRPTV